MNTRPEESSGSEPSTTNIKKLELYLIAHKVRGEPTFDIAIQQPCHHHDWDANGKSLSTSVHRDDPDCDTCDGLGYIWVIPTIKSCSGGWRAFPYWHHPLNRMSYEDGTGIYDLWLHGPELPPDLTDWPDFYPEAYTMFNKKDGEWELPSSTNEVTYSPLADALGLTKPKPKEPIRRI